MGVPPSAVAQGSEKGLGKPQRKQAATSSQAMGHPLDMGRESESKFSRKKTQPGFPSQRESDGPGPFDPRARPRASHTHTPPAPRARRDPYDIDKSEGVKLSLFGKEPINILLDIVCPLCS